MKTWLRIVFTVLGTLLAAVLYVVFLINGFSTISVGEPIPDYPEDKTALMVIDIQEGTSGVSSRFGFFADQAEPFLENVNRIIDEAEAEKLPIIYIAHHNKNWVVNFLTANELKAGVEKTALDKRLKMSGTNLFWKTKMDAFSNPELDTFLLGLKVNHLIITGLDARNCVDKTTRAALNRGYSITSISDAIISETVELRDEAFEGQKEAGATFMTTDEWLKSRPLPIIDSD